MGARVVIYNITQVSFRQGLCPPELLGRMNATMRFLVWGTMPLGGAARRRARLGRSACGTTLLVAAIGGSVWRSCRCSSRRCGIMRELPSYAEPDPSSR